MAQERHEGGPLLLCSLVTLLAAAWAGTLPADKQALLAFKAEVEHDGVNTLHPHCRLLLIIVGAIALQPCQTRPWRLLGTASACGMAMTSQRWGEAHSLPGTRQRCASAGQGLLASWNASGDPCDDAWPFVSCRCADVFPRLSAAECANATGDPAALRVLILEIGQLVQTEGRQLAGTVPACLGNLTALRVLDLHGNQLHVSRSSQHLYPLDQDQSAV